MLSSYPIFQICIIGTRLLLHATSSPAIAHHGACHPHCCTVPCSPLSRARRGNTYEASDIQAALNYYASGSSDMPYEADFAVNRFGTEDAAFFDDIDDNEGYAQSEYLSVGIEEAAPKIKQRQRDDEEAFDEAVEEFDQVGARGARGCGDGRSRLLQPKSLLQHLFK